MTPTLEEQIGEILLRYMFGTAPSEYGIKELATLVREQKKAGVDEFIEALREMMSGEKELGELKMWNYRSKIGPVINLFVKKIEHERKAAYKEGHDEALEIGYVHGVLDIKKAKEQPK